MEKTEQTTRSEVIDETLGKGKLAVMDIEIRETTRGEKCIQLRRGKGNKLKLRVRIPHCDKSIEENLTGDHGWQVHLSRRRAQSSAPFVLKLDKKAADMEHNYSSSLRFNIYSSQSDGCRVSLIGGKINDKINLSLCADFLKVTQNFYASGITSFTSMNGDILINAKVECPVIQLCASNGTRNVSLMSESQLVCHKLSLTAQKNKIEGKLLALKDSLQITAKGDLHLNTHGEIGKCITKNEHKEKVAALVEIDVSGNVWNYGKIIGGSVVNLVCWRYSSCKECPEETVQNGYGAVKSRSNIELKSGNVEEQNCTIKELHGAVKRLDKAKVTALLENGADPLAKISDSELPGNAVEYAIALQAASLGHNDDAETKAIIEIVRVLNWWVRRRGEIISGGKIQITCDDDLEDCSQLTAPHVHLLVNGDAIVEEDSCWSCGIVSGLCKGNMLVYGTWKLSRFDNLLILGNFQTALSAKVIIKEGGNIKVQSNFVNDNQWYNQSDCLSIECGSIFQKEWAAVVCEGVLEFIINNDMVMQMNRNQIPTEEQRWDGEVNVLTLLMITVRSKVQCYANVKCHKLIQIVLEKHTENRDPFFEIAGQFSIENGPLQVDVEPDTFAESDPDELIISGKLSASSLFARNVHAHLLSECDIKLSSVQSIYLIVGTLVTDKGSLIDATVGNNSQKLVMECRNALNHNGQLCTRNVDNSYVTGEITTKTFINKGLIEGFNILSIVIFELFHNYVALTVQEAVTIAGQGKFINNSHSGLICRNGPVTVESLKDVYVMDGSEMCGRTIELVGIERVVNKGTVVADSELTVAMVILDNKKGTLISQDSTIEVHWLSKEECSKQKLEGTVLTTDHLLLTTAGESSLTIQCTDEASGECAQENPVFKIPENGLSIVAPSGCVILKSALDGPSGNETVNISTGIGCVVHSKSYIPNCALSVQSQKTIFFGTENSDAALQFSQMVMITPEGESNLILKGNLLVKDNGVIICKNVNLTIEGILCISGYCEILSPEVTSSKTSQVLMCYEDDVDSEVFIKSTRIINIFGSVKYGIQRQGSASTFKCVASNVTISDAEINVNLFAAQVENEFVIEGNGDIKSKQICAEVGTFTMKDKATLTVTGNEESVIVSKAGQTHLSGILRTEGAGSLHIQSEKNISLESIYCELENKSTRLESVSSIEMDTECQVHLCNSKLTLVTTKEEGNISVNGKISSNHCKDETIGEVVIESYCITLGHLSCTQLKSMFLYAENIIDLYEESFIQDCGCVTIEAKVLEMKGAITNIQSIFINPWSSTITGSITECGEIKIISELLLVNSGRIQGRHIGISAPVYLSVPFKEHVVEAGSDETESLVIEGLLSIWVKSTKQARCIKLNSVLHFEFSSATSTMPNAESLDNWKNAMQNVLKPAAAEGADMQSLLDSAMKIKKVACNLGSASLLCQDIMKISESIRHNGVQGFQMVDIVGALDKAHSQYSNIRCTLRELLRIDPLLRKIKQKCNPVKKMISDIFGKQSFSETLLFNTEENEYGSVQENTFVSMRDSNSDVQVSGTYQANSKLWRNEARIVSCGDLFVSADFIQQKGTDTRIMKACRRLIMTGQNLNVKEVQGSLIDLTGSSSVKIEKAQCDQLKVDSKEVEVGKTSVKEIAEIQAKNEANINMSTFENLQIKGKTVSVDSTKINEAVLEGSNLNVSNVEGTNISCVAEKDVVISNVDTSDTLNVSSQGADVKLKGKVKAKNASIQANSGTVKFDTTDKEGSMEFQRLDLKQKSMETSFEDLVNCLKISDHMNLAVDDHFTLNAQRKLYLNHGLSVEAKSINVKSSISSKRNVSLHANDGGIHVQENKGIEAESVSLKAKGDIIHKKRTVVKANKDVIEESSEGSIILNAANVSGGRYVELDAARDISISAVGGENSAADRSSVSGGTGHDYEDNGQKRKLGLKLKAGENISVDASSVGSKADNLITARREIEFKARSHKYCSKRKTKRGFFKTKKIEEWSTHVDRSEVTSSGGRNIIQAEEGGIKSTATDFRAQENQMVAKGHVTLQDLVTKTERFTKTCDSFGGIFYNKQRRETHEQCHGTVIRDESAYANTILMSKTKDINIEGSTVTTKGNLHLKADHGKIRIKERVLNHTVDESVSGFFMKKPDKKTNTKLSFGYKVEHTKTDYQNTAGNKINVCGSMSVKANELESDASCNVGRNLILDVKSVTFSAPKLKHSEEQMSGGFECGMGHMSLYNKYTKKNSMKRADSALIVGGTMHVKGEDFNAVQGYGIHVKNDLILDVNSFKFEGAKETYQSTSHNVTLGLEDTELKLGYSGDFSDGTCYRNQKTSVGGKMIANNVKKGSIDAANVECENISANIENLTLESRQDSHQSTGTGVSLGVDIATKTPSVEVGAFKLKEQHVSDIASLGIKSGGSENLRVGNLNITGAEIMFAGNVHNFAKNIVSKDLHDISDFLNTNIKVGKPNPKQLQATLSIGCRNKKTVIRGTVSSAAGTVDQDVARKVNTDRSKTREVIHDIGASATITLTKTFEGSSKRKRAINKPKTTTESKSFEFSATGSVQSGDKALSINVTKDNSKGLAGNLSCQSGNQQIGAGFSSSGDCSVSGNIDTGLGQFGVNKACNTRTGEESMGVGFQNQHVACGLNSSSNSSTGEKKIGGMIKTDEFNAALSKGSNSKTGQETVSAGMDCVLGSFGVSASSNSSTGEQNVGAMVKTDAFSAGFNKGSNSQTGQETMSAGIDSQLGSFGVSASSNSSTGEHNIGAMVKTDTFSVGINKGSNSKTGQESLSAGVDSQLGSFGASASSNSSTGEHNIGAMVKTDTFSAGINKGSNSKTGHETVSAGIDSQLGSFGVSSSSNSSTGEQNVGAMVKTNAFSAGISKGSNSKTGQETVSAGIDSQLGSFGVSASSNSSTGEQNIGAVVKTDTFSAGINKGSNSKTGQESLSAGIDSQLGSFGVSASSNSSTGEQNVGAVVKTDAFSAGINKGSNSKTGQETVSAGIDSQLGSFGVSASSNSSTGEQNIGAVVKTDTFSASINKGSNSKTGQESLSAGIDSQLGSFGVSASSNSSTGEQNIGAVVKTDTFSAGINKGSNSKTGQETVSAGIDSQLGSFGVNASSDSSTGEQNIGAVVKTDTFSAGINKGSNNKTGQETVSAGIDSQLGSFGVSASSNSSTGEQNIGAMVKTDTFSAGINKGSNSKTGQETVSAGIDSQLGSFGVSASSNSSTGEQNVGAMVKTNAFSAGISKGSNSKTGQETVSAGIDSQLGSFGVSASSNSSTGEQNIGAVVKTDTFSAGINKGSNSKTGQETVSAGIDSQLGSFGVSASSNSSTGEQNVGAVVKTDAFSAGISKGSNSKTGQETVSAGIDSQLGRFGVKASSNSSTGEQNVGAIVKTDAFSAGINKGSNSKTGQETVSAGIDSQLGSFGVSASSNSSTGEQNVGAVVKTDAFSAGISKGSNSKTGQETVSAGIDSQLGRFGVKASSNSSTGEQNVGAMVKTDAFSAGINKGSNSKTGQETVSAGIDSQLGSFGVSASSNSSTGEQNIGAVVKTDTFSAGINKGSNSKIGQESLSAGVDSQLGSFGVSASSNSSTGEQNIGAVVKTDTFSAGINKGSNSKTGQETVSAGIDSQLGSFGVSSSSNSSTGEQNIGAVVKTDAFSAGISKGSNSKTGQESLSAGIDSQLGSFGVSASSNSSTGEQNIGAVVKTDTFSAGINKGFNRKTGQETVSAGIDSQLGSFGVNASSNSSTGEQNIGAVVKTDTFSAGINKGSNNKTGQETVSAGIDSQLGSFGVSASSNSSTGEQNIGAMVKTDTFSAGINKGSNSKTGQETVSAGIDSQLGSFGVSASSNSSTGEQNVGAMVKTNAFSAGISKGSNSKTGQETVSAGIDSQLGSFGVSASSNSSTGEQNVGAVVKTDTFSASINKGSNSKTGQESLSAGIDSQLGSFGVSASSNSSTGEQNIGAVVKTDTFSAGINKGSNSKTGQETVSAGIDSQLGSFGVSASSNSSTGEQNVGAVVKTDAFSAGISKGSNSKTGQETVSAGIDSQLGRFGVKASSNSSTGEQNVGAIVKTDAFSAGINKGSNSKTGQETVSAGIDSQLGSFGVSASSNSSTGEQNVGAVVKTDTFSAGINKGSNSKIGQESLSAGVDSQLGSFGVSASSNSSTGEQNIGAVVKTDTFSAGITKGSNSKTGQETVSAGIDSHLGSFGVSGSSNSSTGEQNIGAVVKTDAFSAGISKGSNSKTGQETVSAGIDSQLGSFGVKASSNSSTGEQNVGAIVKIDTFSAGINKGSNSRTGQEAMSAGIDSHLGSFGVSACSNLSTGEQKIGAMVKTDTFSAGINKGSNSKTGQETVSAGIDSQLGSFGVSASSNSSTGEQNIGAVVKTDTFSAGINKGSNSKTGQESLSAGVDSQLGSFGVSASSNSSKGEQNIGAMVKTDSFSAGINKGSNSKTGQETVSAGIDSQLGSFGVSASSNCSTGEQNAGAMVKTDAFSAGINKGSNSKTGQETLSDGIDSLLGSFGVSATSNSSTEEQNIGDMVKTDAFSAGFNKDSNSKTGQETMSAEIDSQLGSFGKSLKIFLK